MAAGGLYRVREHGRPAVAMSAGRELFRASVRQASWRFLQPNISFASEIENQ